MISSYLKNTPAHKLAHIAKMGYGPNKDTPFYKVYNNADEVVADIPDGSHINAGAFGLCGITENLIHAIKKKGVKELTIAGNNAGSGDFGMSELINSGQIKKVICSYIGWNHNFNGQWQRGEIESEIIPQGNIAEMMRAAGAGIPSFYTATGANTMIEQGGWVIKYEKGTGKPLIVAKPRESRDFFDKKKGQMRHYIRMDSMWADYALVKADVCDWMGNCRFKYTARNFNPDAAKSAKCCIVEAEEIVEPGVLKGDDIHLPGIYVHRIVKSKDIEKRIENLLLDRGKIKVKANPKEAEKIKIREKIVKRAAKDIKNGMYVNLGAGIPLMIPSFLPPNIKIIMHSENGLLGIGPFPKPGQEDPDLINAGKETVTTIPGHSFFESSESFSIIRGGHLNMTVLGSMQVSASGDIANWYIPKVKLTGMGGAMDLVESGSEVMVLMEHTNKGKAKVMEKCEVPLTGAKCVSKCITERAYFTFPKNGRITLKEIAKEYTLEDIRNCTDAKFEVDEDLKQF